MNSIAATTETIQATELEGLSADEAARRLATYGLNEPARTQTNSAFREIWRLLLNPLVLILLIAGGVSASVGEMTGAVLIIAITLLGLAVDFVQTHRSQNAVALLNKNVAMTATVLRDGQWQEIVRSRIVPGDLIRLSAGDLVPADAVVLQAKDLHVLEAALTGESMPAEKEAACTKGHSSPSARNTVFLGSSVVSGNATARVIATGKATALGDVATHLSTRPTETEFERGSQRFAGFILEIAVFLTLFVFLVKIVLHHDPLQSLLFAVALAVGITPEFLPMILSITLAQGAVRMSRERVIVKHLAAIQNLGSMDVLCSDKTGTLTSGIMSLDRQLDPFGQNAGEVLGEAFLNSYFQTGIKNPLDLAILQHPFKGIDDYQKLDEVPFDFERRRVSVVVSSPQGIQMIVKGSPESVLPVCRSARMGGKEVAFDDAARRRCQTVYEGLGAQGLRVLAVAARNVERQSAYRATDETELVLLGFLAFSDPPLPDMSEVLEMLHADGVTVKILTGDSELVARHLCDTLRMDASTIVLGTQLDRMGDTALGFVAERTTLFARMTPAHKTRVIAALQRRGHVVGFLGDGINDAPSLHAADVGISVASAVDIAKEAAEIILLERSLRVLHAGILEGRKAFGNVTKYLLMGTSSNFGNMLSMAAASVFLPFLPMLPAQILLNNFLYDLAQIAIPADNVDPSFIIKPRRWNIAAIRRFTFYVGPISSAFDIVTFAVLLWWFHGSESSFQTGWFVESLATQTLVIFVIRTGRSIWSSRPSGALTASVLAVVALGLLLPYTPVASSLGFVPLPATYLLFLSATTTAYLSVVGYVKRRILSPLLD